MRRLFQAPLAAAALAAGLLTLTSPAQASRRLENLQPVLPVMTCAAVTGLNLDHATDGTVTITSATEVTTGVAPYCEVKGTISPANTIVLRLPIRGWTQRYVQTGCGGLCGSSTISYGKGADCQPVKDGSVASATTDMGHQGFGAATWAVDNPQSQIDFAYRGVHATAQVAKAVIAKFYGQAQVHAYFIGCSDGGREALMEAQRYPKDFDGIVAGAPASNMVVQNTFHHGWNVLANKDANGHAVLLAGKLPLIHQAVLDACDGIDGLVDGLIGDPRQCKFEPRTMLCQDGQDAQTCLSETEAAVVSKLHDGARTADGRLLEQATAHEWGSELAWTLFVPATPDATTGSENIMLGFYRYLAYYNQYNASRPITDLAFTADNFWQTAQTSAYLSATDPDLSVFRRRGGKLLLWHGWNDEHISPQATLNYWDALKQTFGTDKLNDFARLYLLPGVAHCGGGEGPDAVDMLTPLMSWVERGAAPHKIVTSKVVDSVVTRTRPVYPYPLVARYSGSGSIDDATSFNQAVGAVAAKGDEDWLGRKLYSHGYQATCQADGTQLVCTPSKLPFGRGH